MTILDDDTLALARLAWWLGPWSPRGARPAGVRRRALTLGAGGPSFLYQPTDRPARAAWLISPGLHPDGPDDARMDRFAHVLAASGAVVLSPRSPALCELRLGPEVVRCLAGAADALTAEPAARDLPLRVASVSVGSLAALRLAAEPATAARLDRLVVIGGYADPEALMASLCGADPAPRDPLNQPAAFLTLLDHLPVAIHDRARLVAAWRWFVRTAWPREAWKRPGSTAHHACARELTREVDARDRELFLVGCGVVPGGHALCRAALAAGPYAYLDPRPHLAGVRAEVTAIHGLTDTVIPIGQLDALVAALPRVRAVRLGGFAHSRPVGAAELVRHLPRAADEVRAFATVLRAVA